MFDPNLTTADIRPIIRRELRSAIWVVMPDNRVLFHKFRKGHTNNAATFAAWHRSCGASFPGATVLNELPFEDAVQLFVSALRQPELVRQ